MCTISDLPTDEVQGTSYNFSLRFCVIAFSSIIIVKVLLRGNAKSRDLLGG